jgi:hypothetical protein
MFIIRVIFYAARSYLFAMQSIKSAASYRIIHDWLVSIDNNTTSQIQAEQWKGGRVLSPESLPTT